MDRVFYSSSVHDEREIDAVVEVLRSGPQGLWPGRRVVAMERSVSALFRQGARRDGQLRLTFSTDVAPIVRAGLTPVFVDVEPDTFCVDVDRVDEMVTSKTVRCCSPT